MRHRSSQGVQYQGLRQQLRTKAQTTLYFAKLSNSRKWRYTCAQCMQNRPVHHIIATPFALRPTQQPLLSLPSRRSLLKKKKKLGSHGRRRATPVKGGGFAHSSRVKHIFWAPISLDIISSSHSSNYLALLLQHATTCFANQNYRNYNETKVKYWKDRC